MPEHPNDQNFTRYGWAVCLWVLVTTFQYGYHISVLNQIQAVMTCRGSPNPIQYGLPTCIPMSDFTFSVVTAIFTVGGLTGSLVANIIMDRWGRKGATKASSLLVCGGAVMMGISNSVGMLAFGRFLVGVGSGTGLCVTPVFLAEISPPKISGNVGVLTQLGIVLGIMITQALGLRFATPSEWRVVLCTSSVLSGAQFLSSALVTESPVWLGTHGRPDERKVVAKRLWGDDPTPYSSSNGVEENPLLDEPERTPDVVQKTSITVPQLLAARELRKPVAIVCLAMASQQLSGINAGRFLIESPLDGPDLWHSSLL